MVAGTKAPPKKAAKKSAKKTASKPKSEAPKKGFAVRATSGKHDVVLRLVGEDPERWEYRKDSKPIAELGSRADAANAVTRDLKLKKPSEVTWARVDDPGPDLHTLNDHDFREEAASLGKKIHKKTIQIELTEKELDGIKARLKRETSERDVLNRQLVALSIDEQAGQGRLRLKGDASKSETNDTKPKADAKAKKKAAPKKKANAKKKAAATK